MSITCYSKVFHNGPETSEIFVCEQNQKYLFIHLQNEKLGGLFIDLKGKQNEKKGTKENIPIFCLS